MPCIDIIKHSGETYTSCWTEKVGEAQYGGMPSLWTLLGLSLMAACLLVWVLRTGAVLADWVAVKVVDWLRRKI